MTTKQEMAGQWNSIVGAVKKKYGQITDDDLRKVQGDSQRLIGLIQQKVGAARSEVEAFVSKVYDDFGASLSQLAEDASEYEESSGGKTAQGGQQSAATARKTSQADTRETVESASHTTTESFQAYGSHYVAEPAKDVFRLLTNYAKERPDVAAVWLLGAGVIVGWKLRG